MFGVHLLKAIGFLQNIDGNLQLELEADLSFIQARKLEIEVAIQGISAVLANKQLNNKTEIDLRVSTQLITAPQEILNVQKPLENKQHLFVNDHEEKQRRVKAEQLVKSQSMKINQLQSQIQTINERQLDFVAEQYEKNTLNAELYATKYSKEAAVTSTVDPNNEKQNQMAKFLKDGNPKLHKFLIVQTELQTFVRKGDKKLEVSLTSSQLAKLKKGMVVLIGNSGKSFELANIYGFGSIILDRQVSYDHEKHSTVLIFSSTKAVTAVLEKEIVRQFCSGVVIEDILDNVIQFCAYKNSNRRSHFYNLSKKLATQNFVCCNLGRPSTLGAKSGNTVSFVKGDVSLDGVLLTKTGNIFVENLLLYNLNFVALYVAFKKHYQLCSGEENNNMQKIIIELEDLSKFCRIHNKFGKLLEYISSCHSVSIDELLTSYTTLEYNCNVITWNSFLSMLYSTMVRLEGSIQDEILSANRIVSNLIFDIYATSVVSQTNTKKYLSVSVLQVCFEDMDGVPTDYRTFSSICEKVISSSRTDNGYFFGVSKETFFNIRQQYICQMNSVSSDSNGFSELFLGSRFLKILEDYQKAVAALFCAEPPHDVIKFCETFGETFSEPNIVSLKANYGTPDYTVVQVCSNFVYKHLVVLDKSGFIRVYQNGCSAETTRSQYKPKTFTIQNSGLIYFKEDIPSNLFEGFDVFYGWIKDFDSNKLKTNGKLIMEFLCETLPSGVLSDFITIDSQLGWIACNHAMINQSVSIYEPVGLKRLFRIKLPLEMSKPLLDGIRSQCGDSSKTKLSISYSHCEGVLSQMSLLSSHSLLIGRCFGHNDLFLIHLFTGNLLYKLSGHLSPLSTYCIGTTLEGKLVLTGSKDSRIRLWNLEPYSPSFNYSEEISSKGSSARLGISSREFHLINQSSKSTKATGDLSKSSTAPNVFHCNGLIYGKLKLVSKLFKILCSSLNCGCKWFEVRVVSYIVEGKNVITTPGKGGFWCEVFYPTTGMLQLIDDYKLLRDSAEMKRNPQGPPNWSEPSGDISIGAKMALFTWDVLELASQLVFLVDGCQSIHDNISTSLLVAGLLTIPAVKQSFSREEIFQIVSFLSLSNVTSCYFLVHSLNKYSMLGIETVIKCQSRVNMADRIYVGHTSSIAALSYISATNTIVSVEQLGHIHVWTIGRSGYCLNYQFNLYTHLHTTLNLQQLFDNSPHVSSVYPVFQCFTTPVSGKCNFNLSTVSKALEIDNTFLMMNGYSSSKLIAKGFIYLLEDKSFILLPTYCFSIEFILLNQGCLRFPFFSTKSKDFNSLNATMDEVYAKKHCITHIIYVVSEHLSTLLDAAKLLFQYGIPFVSESENSFSSFFPSERLKFVVFTRTFSKSDITTCCDISGSRTSDHLVEITADTFGRDGTEVKSMLVPLILIPQFLPLTATTKFRSCYQLSTAVKGYTLAYCSDQTTYKMLVKFKDRFNYDKIYSNVETFSELLQRCLTSYLSRINDSELFESNKVWHILKHLLYYNNCFLRQTSFSILQLLNFVYKYQQLDSNMGNDSSNPLDITTNVEWVHPLLKYLKTFFVDVKSSERVTDKEALFNCNFNGLMNCKLENDKYPTSRYDNIRKVIFSRWIEDYLLTQQDVEQILQFISPCAVSDSISNIESNYLANQESFIAIFKSKSVFEDAALPVSQISLRSNILSPGVNDLTKLILQGSSTKNTVILDIEMLLHNHSILLRKCEFRLLFTNYFKILIPLMPIQKVPTFSGGRLKEQLSVPHSFSTFHLCSIETLPSMFPGLLMQLYECKPLHGENDQSCHYLVWKYTDRLSEKKLESFVMSLKVRIAQLGQKLLGYHFRFRVACPVFPDEQQVHFLGDSGVSSVLIFPWDKTLLSLHTLISVASESKGLFNPISSSDSSQNVMLSIVVLHRIYDLLAFLSTEDLCTMGITLDNLFFNPTTQELIVLLLPTNVCTDNCSSHQQLLEGKELMVNYISFCEAESHYWLSWFIPPFLRTLNTKVGIFPDLINTAWKSKMVSWCFGTLTYILSFGDGSFFKTKKPLSKVTISVENFLFSHETLLKFSSFFHSNIGGDVAVIDATTIENRKFWWISDLKCFCSRFTYVYGKTISSSMVTSSARIIFDKIILSIINSVVSSHCSFHQIFATMQHFIAAKAAQITVNELCKGLKELFSLLNTDFNGYDDEIKLECFIVSMSDEALLPLEQLRSDQIPRECLLSAFQNIKKYLIPMLEYSTIVQLLMICSIVHINFGEDNDTTISFESMRCLPILEKSINWNDLPLVHSSNRIRNYGDVTSTMLSINGATWCDRLFWNPLSYAFDCIMDSSAHHNQISSINGLSEQMNHFDNLLRVLQNFVVAGNDQSAKDSNEINNCLNVLQLLLSNHYLQYLSVFALCLLQVSTDQSSVASKSGMNREVSSKYLIRVLDFFEHIFHVLNLVAIDTSKISFESESESKISVSSIIKLVFSELIESSTMLLLGDPRHFSNRSLCGTTSKFFVLNNECFEKKLEINAIFDRLRTLGTIRFRKTMDLHQHWIFSLQKLFAPFLSKVVGLDDSQSSNIGKVRFVESYFDGILASFAMLPPHLTSVENCIPIYRGKIYFATILKSMKAFGTYNITVTSYPLRVKLSNKSNNSKDNFHEVRRLQASKAFCNSIIAMLPFKSDQLNFEDKICMSGKLYQILLGLWDSQLMRKLFHSVAVFSVESLKTNPDRELITLLSKMHFGVLYACLMSDFECGSFGYFVSLQWIQELTNYSWMHLLSTFIKNLVNTNKFSKKTGAGCVLENSGLTFVLQSFLLMCSSRTSSSMCRFWKPLLIPTLLQTLKKHIMANSFDGEEYNNILNILHDVIDITSPVKQLQSFDEATTKMVVISHDLNLGSTLSEQQSFLPELKLLIIRLSPINGSISTTASAVVCEKLCSIAAQISIHFTSTYKKLLALGHSLHEETFIQTINVLNQQIDILDSTFSLLSSYDGVFIMSLIRNCLVEGISGHENGERLLSVLVAYPAYSRNLKGYLLWKIGMKLLICVSGWAKTSANIIPTNWGEIWHYSLGISTIVIQWFQHHFSTLSAFISDNTYFATRPSELMQLSSYSTLVWGNCLRSHLMFSEHIAQTDISLLKRLFDTYLCSNICYRPINDNYAEGDFSLSHFPVASDVLNLANQTIIYYSLQNKGINSVVLDFLMDYFKDIMVVDSLVKFYLGLAAKYLKLKKSIRSKLCGVIFACSSLMSLVLSWNNLEILDKFKVSFWYIVN